MWICEKGGRCVDPCNDCYHYIEVEPIVRCKRCKYWSCFGESSNKGVCDKCDCIMYDDDFCSYAERIRDILWKRSAASTVVIVWRAKCFAVASESSFARLWVGYM